MTRKLKIINEFELSLIQRINKIILSGGLVKHVSSPQLDLLYFCLTHEYYFHAVIIARVYIECNEYQLVYKVWENLQGKTFLEKQNAEAYLINKALLYRHTLNLKTKH